MALKYRIKNDCFLDRDRCYLLVETHLSRGTTTAWTDDITQATTYDSSRQASDAIAQLVGGSAAVVQEYEELYCLHNDRGQYLGWIGGRWCWRWEPALAHRFINESEATKKKYDIKAMGVTIVADIGEPLPVAYNIEKLAEAVSYNRSFPASQYPRKYVQRQQFAQYARAWGVVAAAQYTFEHIETLATEIAIARTEAWDAITLLTSKQERYDRCTEMNSVEAAFEIEYPIECYRGISPKQLEGFAQFLLAEFEAIANGKEVDNGDGWTYRSRSIETQINDLLAAIGPLGSHCQSGSLAGEVCLQRPPSIPVDLWREFWQELQRDCIAIYRDGYPPEASENLLNVLGDCLQASTLKADFDPVEGCKRCGSTLILQSENGYRCLHCHRKSVPSVCY